jgi:ferredoxin
VSTIVPERCIGCGVCVKSCRDGAAHAIEMTNGVARVDPKKCIVSSDKPSHNDAKPHILFTNVLHRAVFCVLMCAPSKGLFRFRHGSASNDLDIFG